MKFKKIILLVLPAVLFLIFTSCGNENNVSEANTSGTVIFQKDSLSVWLMPSTSDSGSDTLYYSRNDIGGLKVEFTLQSNADSTHSVGYWGLYTNATPHFPIIPVIIGTVNQHSSIPLNFNTVHDTYFAFGMRLFVKGSKIPHFIRIIGIKITKD